MFVAEIVMRVAWWTMKSTASTMYYLLYGYKNEQKKIEYEKKKEAELHKQVVDFENSTFE